MSKQANLFQEALERLEEGESLETSQQSGSVDDQSLLSLAARLRTAAWPQVNPQVARQQKQQVIALYDKEPQKETQNHTRVNIFKDWRLPVAISIAVAVLFICGSMSLLGIGGALWYSNQRANEAPVEQPEIVEEIEGAKAPEVVTTPQDTLSPHEALLSNLNGLVEIQAEEGWQAVSKDVVLTQKSHLRTGNFSSATITFNDGSIARIGPESEISIEKLVTDLGAGNREIELMQWSGESSHLVAPFDNALASYQVDTPSGRGRVTGTQFHVRVMPEQSAWYVDEGTVEVSGQEASVPVNAGEMTSVTTEEEPSDPAYFFAGQGQVALISESWLIGDQTYQTHPQTIIIGNPQVGDMVYYEGHLLEDGSRVADLIVLIRHNPANTFTLTGEVEEIGDILWTVNGQIVAVTDLTDVETGIVVGDLVRIEGVILEDGSLQAEEIRRIPDENEVPFEFTGIVQEIADQSWLISDIPITLDENTALDEGLMVGDLVRVQGLILEDNTWLATSITRFFDENSAFEFVGTLDSMNPWMVSGISFEVREWTAVDEGLVVGDLVRVAGQILPDGTWLASEVRRYDKTLLMVLIGRVFSMEPWVVSGFELNVDEETIIEGEITVGMLVRVELQLLPDGSHKVIRISPFDELDLADSCQYLVVTVISVEEDQITVEGWPALPLGERTQIEGEIQPGSLVQIMICYDEDMNVTVVYIVVLSSPILPPPPVDNGSEKVVVCHKPNSKNPHTIVISSSALPAHLGHGDTLGPCP
jgi:hypothetical protein